MRAATSRVSPSPAWRTTTFAPGAPSTDASAIARLSAGEGFARRMPIDAGKRNAAFELKHIERGGARKTQAEQLAALREPVEHGRRIVGRARELIGIARRHAEESDGEVLPIRDRMMAGFKTQGLFDSRRRQHRQGVGPGNEQKTAFGGGIAQRRLETRSGSGEPGEICVEASQQEIRFAETVKLARPAQASAVGAPSNAG